MPARAVLWLAILLLAAPCRPQSQGTPFRIEQSRLSWDLVTGRLTSERARATWDDSSLTADEITEDRGDIVARGNVVLLDPLGTLAAPELHYNYITESGWALDVRVEGQGAFLTAKSIEMLPHHAKWVARDGTATVCDRHPPEFLVRFDKLVLVPGDRVRIYKARLDIAGQHLLGFPNVQVQLGSGQSFVPPPSFSYSRSTGLAIGSHNWFDLTPRLGLAAAASVFQHGEIERAEQLSYNMLRPGANVIPTPDNEEGERFANSYLDNVNVASPFHEDSWLLKHRQVVFFDNSANIPVAGRALDELTISRDWEFGAQANERLGPLLGTASIRVGRLTEIPTATTVTRTAAQGTVSPGTWRVWRSVFARARVDTGLFSYEHGRTFGWVRPLGEIIVEPSERIRLAAGVANIYSSGAHVLQFDEPLHSRGLHFRGDFGVGGAVVSILTKYDVRTQQVYDVEVSLRLRLHCIEPYFVWRKDVGEFRFGIRIPALDRLQAVAAKRAAELR